MSVRWRKPLPDAIRNAPQLRLGLELYYVAFIELSTDRQLGYGPGPIPWSSVERYCDRHEIVGDQREDMHYHIRALDNKYLQHSAAKSKVESKPPQPAQRQVKGRRK